MLLVSVNSREKGRWKIDRGSYMYKAAKNARIDDMSVDKNKIAAFLDSIVFPHNI
jgi:hypothetical protein